MTVKKTDELVLDAEGKSPVLREPILNRDGSLLLKQGTIINYELASRLKKHDINFMDKLEVQTSNQTSDGNYAFDVVSGEDFETSISAVKEVFESVLENEQTGIKGAIPEEYLELVQTIISDIMEKLMSSEDLLYAVSDLLISDDYTYRHSVNVCILSILTAKAMHYSEEEIKDIALGSLLHDIGKVSVKGGLVQKAGDLGRDEQEEMKKHPEYGYQLIKDIPSIPFSVKQIVRYHHEKLDGSGYPKGLRKMEIPEYVRIVTLCDMYDAMTANRIYRRPMPVYTALEVLMRDCVYKLDSDVFRAMTSTVCIFAMGQGVMLSDGRVGVVSGYRHHSPSRPKVKVIDYCIKTGELDMEEINLEEHHTLFIVDTWDVEGFKAFFKRTPPKDVFDDVKVDKNTLIG